MKMLRLVLAAALMMAGCTPGLGSNAPMSTPSLRGSSALPPRLGAGVRVIVGGDSRVLQENGSVIGVLSRVLIKHHLRRVICIPC
jgi:hypothetical protein